MKKMENKNKDQKNTTPKDLELKDERKKVYSHPESQTLLRVLIKNGNNSEILPVYDPNLGFVYKIADQSLKDNLSHEKMIEVLNRLAELEILKKSFFDSVSACPNCGSTAMTLHFHCKYCKNHNLLKANLTEHIPCGFIIEREKFTDDKCPRCGELLLEENYRDMGRWYICRNCKQKFEHPGLEIICRKCNRKFSIEEAKVIEIPKFSLNLTYKKEIIQNIVNFEKIVELLNNMEFHVEMPGTLVGQKSGIPHNFTLVAKKIIQDKEVVIALDHAVNEKEVGTGPLIVYIYKTSEINIDLPIFVAITKISEEARKITQGHNILLIEQSPESNENIDAIKKEIEIIVKTKISPHLQMMESDDSEENKQKKNSAKFTSELKPQLFNHVPGIHQAEKSNKTKKFKRFMKNLTGNDGKKSK